MLSPATRSLAFAAIAVPLALLCAAGPVSAGVPLWALDWVATPLPKWAEGADELVLLDQRQVVVSGHGRQRTTNREVRRILNPNAASLVLGETFYLAGSTDVRRQHAWILHPDRSVSELDGFDAVDAASLHAGELYGDLRVRSLRAEHLSPGDLVAVECITEETTLLAEWEWRFRQGDPVLRSRFELTLPAGVEPLVCSAGGTSPPAQQGGSWAWERSDIRAWAREPLVPASAYLAEQLSVTVRPGSVSPKLDIGRSFASWGSASAWISDISAPARLVTPEIVSKAAELKRGSVAPLDWLRALTRFVQGLNYVAIDLGLERGGGFTPHRAGDVLRLGYGDCKDKASLLCALAEAAGFEAHLVAANIPDPTRVRPGIPSPNEFNHCIAAIRLPEGLMLPTVQRDSVFGPLVYFDATDPVTPLGDLPRYEQGAHAMIVDSGRGRLVELPTVPLVANRSRLTFAGVLDRNGDLGGTLTRDGWGQDAAADVRIRSDSRDGFREYFRRWLSSGGRSVDLDSLRFTRSDDGLRTTTRARVTYRYSTGMTGSGILTLPVCPGIVHELEELGDSTRSLPLLTPLLCEEDSVAVELPPDFMVDDLPEPVERHTDFADLSVEWGVRGQQLRFVFRLEMHRRELPASRFAELRDLFRDANRARRGLVVLTRR